MPSKTCSVPLVFPWALTVVSLPMNASVSLPMTTVANEKPAPVKLWPKAAAPAMLSTSVSLWADTITLPPALTTALSPMNACVACLMEMKSTDPSATTCEPPIAALSPAAKTKTSWIALAATITSLLALTCAPSMPASVVSFVRARLNAPPTEPEATLGDDNAAPPASPMKNRSDPATTITVCSSAAPVVDSLTAAFVPMCACV